MANLIRFENSDIVNDVQKVVTSTWSDNTNNLTTQFTSSTQADFTSPTSSGAHFIEVHHNASTASAQFAVAYGHRAGSGSLDFTNDTGAIGQSATRNIYSQYRQLVFGDEASDFSFNGHVPQGIFVININRARYKHNLKPGTLDLRIASSSAVGKEDIGVIKLTDDSVTTTGSSTVTNAGRQFNIVSGSLGTMSGSSLSQLGTTGSYGLFYPDMGFIILNEDALNGKLKYTETFTETATSSPFITASANTANNNHRKLAKHISSAAHFIVDSEEKVSSQFYFARAKNNQFNYTTNPSFVDGNGNVNIDSFIDNPTTFITTVGLYNDNNDLVAVAKLSQPVTKDFTKEALIRVKLDY